MSLDWKRIHAIRHGQSEHNVLGSWSYYDERYKYSQLTEFGIKQARDCPRLIVDVIYVSPLRRTLQTCCEIFGTQPAIAIPELREVDLSHVVNSHEDRESLILQYPHINFDAVDTVDIKRYADNHDEKLERLVDILKSSPAREIALITHNDLMHQLFKHLEMIPHQEQLDHARPYSFTLKC